MLFNSLQYLLFLPLVALLYWRAPRVLRLPILLVASYAFYMSWMKIYGLLLFGLTAVNFVFGLCLQKTEVKAAKRLVFISGLSINLFCLGLFKYTNFLLDSFRGICDSLGANHLLSAAAINALKAPDPHDLPIILPLGISFFVFEFIHYLTDIFKGDKAIKSPLKFALFAAFFPSQIAGPIKRYQDFVKQEVADAKFDGALFHTGILLLAQGMFKKVALGDNLAPIVQQGFANPQMMGTMDAWACVLAFSLQIYYDFSGYTDIAIGSANILGFRLPENFKMPYSATSLKDFWHRWHISLSTWLRDYLYIPLGGSRKGGGRALANLLITMLLGGLWHGASWNFVIWGGMHGLGLTVNRLFDDLLARNSALQAASKTWLWEQVSRLSIFLFVTLVWVVFRAQTTSEAFAVYHSLFNWQPVSLTDISVIESILQSNLLLSFGIYTSAYLLIRYAGKLCPILPEFLRPARVPMYAEVVLLSGLAILIVGLAPHAAIPFIYFQF